MKVFSALRKRAIIIIGVLAIATISLVPLSSAHNGVQPLVVSSSNQSLTSKDTTGGTKYHSSLATTSNTQLQVANYDDSSSNLNQNVVGSTGSTQPSTSTSNTNPVTPADPSATPISPSNVSCSPPCGPEQPNNYKLQALVCPMLMCDPVTTTPPTTTPPQQIQPNPMPQPNCTPCGGSVGGGDSAYACDMVCAE